ncbi:hypothetical protein PAMP_008019 [Pampus punctatissimus]
MQDGKVQSKRKLPSEITGSGRGSSELFDSLKVYLNNKNRLQPIIGLGSITECVKMGSQGREALYLCDVCVCRLSKADMRNHIMGSLHRYNYIKAWHPCFVSEWKENSDLSLLAWPLMEKAKMLEGKEGPGDVKMESHPELVEDINDNRLLQSLAEKIEQEEGRGELVVVNAPESLCVLLTGKSYHWCIKMLCNGWTHNNIQKRKIAVKGQIVNKTFNQGMPEKVFSKRAKRMAKRRMTKVTNTVFKVCVPITKGSVLLERTSFSMDSLPVSSTYSPLADSDPIPLPEIQTEECESDYDSGSFAINHSEHISLSTPLKLHLHSGVSDSGQYVGPERNSFTHFQEVDTYFSNGDYFNQSDDITNIQNQKACEERHYNRLHRLQEQSKKFYEECQNKGQLPAVSHGQEWSSYHCSDRHEVCTEQWYNSTFQNKVGSRVDVPREERHEVSSNATQQYYQQQPITQYMAPDHNCLTVGSVGPHLDVAEINMYSHMEDSHVHSGKIASEPREQYLEMEQGILQTCTELSIGHVQTTELYDTTFQAIQVGHRVMSNPSYNIGLRTNPDQFFPHPVSGGSGDMYHSNAFNSPGQVLCYEENVAGAPPYMLAYHSTTSLR